MSFLNKWECYYSINFSSKGIKTQASLLVGERQQDNYNNHTDWDFLAIEPLIGLPATIQTKNLNL